MVTERYKRFDLARPQYLGDEHWVSISTELDRLQRSLDAHDDHQVISDLKCLVEAIAKVTLDIDGSPAASNASFPDVVKTAHGKLAQQPGRELAYRSHFGHVATQASKIAVKLGDIRNEFGGGHGRAHQPGVRDEMVDLTLDGALLWARWALRRLGYFSEGRPSTLIRDLVDQPQSFSRGQLRQRLESANLAVLEERHQRAIGVAVGQRSNRGTFVVQWDGVDSCLASDSLAAPWTTEYRMGLARGLWFAADESPTITPRTIREALSVLDPVPDTVDFLVELCREAVATTLPGLPSVADRLAVVAAAEFVRGRAIERPAFEEGVHFMLAHHLDGR